jgi:hypothetical protein
MGNSTDIEILEGETLDDAIKRIAKGMAPPEAKPKKDSASKSPSKSKKSKPTNVDPTPPVEVPIYAAFHMYLLPGRTIEKVRSDARRERQMYGPGVAVFIHAHQPGEGCADKCAELIQDA